MSMLEVASVHPTRSFYSSELNLPHDNYAVHPSPESRERGPIRLTPSMMPSCSDYEVEESSFFSRWDKLPAPEEVRSQAYIQYASGINLDKRKTFSVAGPHVAPPPVLFKDMGLFVKWGISARISEAQTLYAIRHVLNGAVPVPEVYGWKTQGDEKFVYMEYIPGQSLESAWSTLEHDDRLMICRELRTICGNLRRLEQGPSDNFVGNIKRSALYDRALHNSYMSEAGPFTTVRDFHEWFAFLPRRRMSGPHSVPIEPFRHELPDECDIKFTHGDLHPSNIIITSSAPYRVVAIVDWEQSGWLPSYWEVRKAQFTADRDESWSTTYLPIFLDQYTSTWDPWDYYTMSTGC